jgi:glycosyltransferase involved in cell wall biosynthesis
MKILYIIPSLLEFGGGTERVKFLLSLFKKENSVSVVEIGKRRYFNDSKFIELKFSFFEKIINLFRVYAYPFSSYVEKEILKIFKENSYDLIIVSKFQILFYLRNFKDNKKVIVDLWACGLDDAILELKIEKNIFKKMIFVLRLIRYYITDRLLYKRFYNYFVVSKKAKEYIEKRYKNKNIYIIPHTFEVKNIDFNKKRNFDFVFIGDLSFHPNFNSVLKFYEYGRNLDTKLFVVGGYKDEHKKYFKNDNIEFLGNLEDIDELMKNNIFFWSVIDGGLGLRTKIIKAFSYAMCVFANRNSLEGINYKDMENVVIIESKNDFLKKYNQLGKDLEIAKKIGINAYNYLKKELNSENIYKEIKKVFYEILGNNNNRRQA